MISAQEESSTVVLPGNAGRLRVHYHPRTVCHRYSEGPFTWFISPDGYKSATAQFRLRTILQRYNAGENEQEKYPALCYTASPAPGHLPFSPVSTNIRIKSTDCFTTLLTDSKGASEATQHSRAQTHGEDWRGRDSYL